MNERRIRSGTWDEWAQLMRRTASRVICKKMKFLSLRQGFWQWHAAACEERLQPPPLPPPPPLPLPRSAAPSVAKVPYS